MIGKHLLIAAKCLVTAFAFSSPDHISEPNITPINHIKSRQTPASKHLTIHSTYQATASEDSIIATTFRRMSRLEKTNPTYDCPFTNQNAFLIGAGTNCGEFTTTEGITAIQLPTLAAPPNSLFLPFIACATNPVETFVLPGNFAFECLYLIVSGKSSVEVSAPIDYQTCRSATGLRTMCIFPLRSTSQGTFGVEFEITATGFVDVPTFVTTTAFFSATVTITTTRTSSTTTTTFTTNTVTIESLTSTTIPTTSTITFSEDVYDDITESTSTTTYIVSTSVSLSKSTVSLTTVRSHTRTFSATSCLGPFGQSIPKFKPTPYLFRQERIEQVQCPIPYAGSVYNSNIGSSISTICNVAGATQLLTNESVYNTWLWSMIKTYTPCAYADLDSVFWIGSSAGNCYALESITTAIKPCSSIYPVICINISTTQVDPGQVVYLPPVIVTDYFTVSTVIISRPSTVSLTINRSVISTEILTIPTFTTTTKTSTRNSEVTTTSTVSVTSTGYSLTTATSTVSDTVDTTTITLSSVVLTRTITSETTLTSISTKLTTMTTVTETINSCPVTVTRTLTLSSTYSTVITNVIPIYSTTIYTTDSQCYIPDTTTWATSGCGCANAVSG